MKELLLNNITFKYDQLNNYYYNECENDNDNLLLIRLSFGNYFIVTLYTLGKKNLDISKYDLYQDPKSGFYEYTTTITHLQSETLKELLQYIK